MSWWAILIIIFGALLALFAIGMPVAFAFLAINVVAAFIFWNGAAGLNQLVLSVMESVTHFGILPVPLFILMGEVLFRSGIAAKVMEVLDSWIGRLPGRLSLMAVGGGTLFLVSLAYEKLRHIEGMGQGDVKLGLMLGAFTGWQGALFTLMAASTAGALIGLLLIFTRGADGKTRIPFGTFLAPAAVLALFVAPAFFHWYGGFLRR